MHKKKIFIVDDDPLFSSMLSGHLEDLRKYEVHRFDTGEKCLENIFEEPDVIILDYFLNKENPEAKNGLEILSSIRKIDPHLKVIMLSAQERYGIAAESIMKGAVHYVIKDNSAVEEVDRLLEAL